MKLTPEMIDGFESMTAEQKVEALLGFDFDPSKNGYRTQIDFDKIMSENKQKKDEIRKLKEELAQGTGASSELEKRIAELEKVNNDLARQSEIARLTASFVKLGYSEELAGQAAVASADKDITKVLEIQTKYQAEHDEAVRKEAFKGMRKPGGGAGAGDDGKDTNPYLSVAKDIGKDVAEATSAAKGMDNYFI